MGGASVTVASEQDRMGFQPFLVELAALISEIPKEDLDRVVLSWGKDVPASERREFIEEIRELARPPPKRRGSKATQQASAGRSASDDPRLLEEIAKLREALAEGEYSQGWGWDDEIGEEREWGDESWATEMDGLFGRAQAAFEGGDFKLARAALGALLACLEMEYDGEGHFPGQSDPEEMLETDVREARAMYLRSVYETQAPASRPKALLGALAGVGVAADLEGIIQAMLECRATRPRDESEFLAAWETLLRARRKEPAAATLLREVVKLRRGSAGLRELASGAGGHEAAVWRELAAALEREGDALAATNAREEGAAAVKDRMERAELLDAAEVGYRKLGDEGARERCVIGALAAGPDFARLGAAGGLEGDKGLRAVSAALFLKGPGWEERPDVRAAALALVGRFGEAVELSRMAKAHGWTTGHNPQALIVPLGFLFVARGAGSKLPPNVVSAFARAMADALEDSAISSTKALIRAFEASGPAPEEAVSALPALLAMAQARVDVIVGEGRSRHYSAAAGLLAAGAEAVALRMSPGKAEELLAHVVARHSAHWGFRQALRHACSRSAVLKPLGWEERARELRRAAGRGASS